MKIALFDTNQFKFTQGMIDHWRENGHEVKRFHTTHIDLIDWADLLWFDCVDQNLVCATTRLPDVIAGKRIIARAIDIDVWASHFNAVNWSLVDDLIFIAPHIRNRMLSKKPAIADVTQVHLVPCGVDLDKFTFRRDPRSNRDIAVVMRLWYGKGMDLLLQAILQNPGFTFHICGKWGLSPIEDWYRAYWDEMLEGASNWTYVERVNDMNEWLEGKDRALICSKKEAFSYAAAEAAAKGIQPMLHTFYGHKAIWPPAWCWKTLDDLTEMLYHPQPPSVYRHYVEDRYSLSKMMEALDAIIAG